MTRKRAMSDASSELSSVPPSSPLTSPRVPAKRARTTPSSATPTPKRTPKSPSKTPKKPASRPSSAARKVSKSSATKAVTASSSQATVLSSPSKPRRKKEDPFTSLFREASESSARVTAMQRRHKREERKSEREEAAHLRRLESMSSATVRTRSPIKPAKARTPTPEFDWENYVADDAPSIEEAFGAPPRSSPLSSPEPEPEAPPVAELPDDVYINSNCIFKPRYTWFVGRLAGWHPTERYPFEVENSAGEIHRLPREKVLFIDNAIDARKLPDYRLSEIEFFKRKRVSPENDTDTTPFADLSFRGQVKRMRPHLLRIVNERYPPAQWRVNKFYDNKKEEIFLQTGDLESDERMELCNVIVKWALSLTPESAAEVPPAVAQTVPATVEAIPEAVPEAVASTSSTSGSSSQSIVTPTAPEIPLPEPSKTLNEFPSSPPPLSPSLGLVPTSPATVDEAAARAEDTPATPDDTPVPPGDAPAPSVSRFWALNSTRKKDFAIDVLYLEAIIARAARMFPSEGDDKAQYDAASRKLTAAQERKSAQDRWALRHQAVREKQKAEQERRDRENPTPETFKSFKGRQVKAISYASPPKRK